MGNFRTGPRGRAAFTFTSFGDQGTPTVGKVYTPPAGVTLPSLPFVNDNLGSPAAGDTTAGVERVQPLFHLFNGDLCYANLATDRVRTWTRLLGEQHPLRAQPALDALGRQPRDRARQRPARLLRVPDLLLGPGTPGQTSDTKGLWYAFTVGAVRVHQHQQRRRVPAERRRRLQPGLLARRPEGVARARAQERRAIRRHRLDRRLHAPGGDQHRRQVQRRRPRHPAGVVAAVRQVRRRPRRVRARAPLRALAPDPRPAGQRDADADPGGDGAPTSSTPPRAPCTWSSAAAAPRRRPTSCSSTRRSAG